MAVYPFYAKIDSSTRNSEVGVGCRKKDGYLTTNIFQRNGGSIENPYTIKQVTTYNEETKIRHCTTRVYFNSPDGLKLLHEYVTTY